MKKIDTPSSNRAPADRLLRLREVLEIIPVSRTTWYDGMAIGIYPRPVSVGGRRVAWFASAVFQCIEDLNKQSAPDAALEEDQQASTPRNAPRMK